MFIRPSVYTEIFVAILRRTDGQQFNHQFASNFMIYDLLSDKLLLSRKNNIIFYLLLEFVCFPYIFIQSSSLKGNQYSIKIATTIEPP